MEGEEKKSGLKKRSKPVGIGLDADDDEPIGSLLKVKKTRNPKKVKVGLEFEGEKGSNAKVIEGKMAVQSVDLGGMDDTLASFRKKLKGPKKDGGSGTGRIRGCALNTVESSNGPLEDEILDVEVPSKTVENGHETGGNRSDATMDERYGIKSKVRRSKTDYPKKAVESCGATDAGLESLGFKCSPPKDQNVAGTLLGEGPSHSMDENLEDSLSAYIRKSQSGSIKKTRTSPNLRQKSGNQKTEDDLNPTSDCVSEGFQYVVLRRPLYASPNQCLEVQAPDCALLESQSEGTHENPMVDLNGPNFQEGHDVCTCGSIEICNGNTKLCNCHQVKDMCYDSCQKVNLGTENTDGLKPCSVRNESTFGQDDEVSNSISAPMQMEEIRGLNKGEFNSGLNYLLDKKSEGGDIEHCENASKDLNEHPSSNKNSSHCHIESGEAVKYGNGFACDLRPKVSQQIQPCSPESAMAASEVRKMGGKFDGSDTCIKEPDITSVFSEKENPILSDGTATSSGIHKFRFASEIDQQERSLGTCDISKPSAHGLHPNEVASSGQMRYSASNQNRSSDTSKGTDYPILIEEDNEASSPSTSPDQNVSYLEKVVRPSSSGNKDNKASASLRLRKTKRHRHRDMAYEGDADWENLMLDQRFLESHQIIDSDRSSRVRDKFGPSLNLVTDSEACGAAAVSAGLKAHAVGPVERIKFKEVLKRKGGLQEYLEYRNQILGLWNKNVSRVLPLSECGVSDIPSEDEPSHVSFIREIYTFLDQSGYINVGIASKKDKTEPNAKLNYKLLEEKKFEASSGASIADSEEGVSFILGQIKTTDASIEGKNGAKVVDENQTSEATKDQIPFPTESEVACPGDNYQEKSSIDAKAPNRTVTPDILSTVQSFEMLDIETVPLVCPEPIHDSGSAQFASSDLTEGNRDLQCDSEARKRIIVIGAGPAGLTAARHLQRQGFSVTVLEARSRIGGRVYTDRSSLSVPVDLGASIITGVEADVDTERRPDPSSLVCAQLGLELTVLNSDCPLYDIVTGHKVPAELDEALEAEYNSLLDDMVLLVAQKGEQAMRMSLEDGLEYALSRRRMARLGINSGETEHQNRGDSILAAKKMNIDVRVREKRYSEEEILSPLERRVMDWHFAHLEYGCAALLKEVSLPYWNQDDVYGGFGGPHCMIKGGYSTVVESLGEGLSIHLNHVVTDVSYTTKDSKVSDGKCNNVTVSTSNGSVFSGDAVLITVPLGCLKAEAIKFSPPLPQWKLSSVQRLGFGVLNKVVLEFPEIFWDDSVDYFGATAEETHMRGQCFMFWNVRKTVGAPVLIALLVGKAAIDGQNMSSSDHVGHALMVLRKLFGESSVPDPVGSVVTDWGRDPFSYGAYSYVAVGASGEDYDILGRPVDNCLFFAGEATCKEHPDTVGGAMMSGLREAVRIIDIFRTGNDYTAEIEAMKAAQRQTDSERDEVRDITTRLDAVELSNALYKSSLDGTQILTREALLQDMFFNAKTTAGRLHLAKDLLHLPVDTLKSFAGTRKGLTKLNSWILDSMGKDGTQLLRHCVRLLVRVSTDLLAVRLSGIGKTVKEKVCVHTSRDIRAIASQLVNVWLEVFRKEKASNSRLKLLRQTAVDSLRGKLHKDPTSGKPPLRTHHGTMDIKGSLQVPTSAGYQLPSKVNGKPAKLDSINDSKSEVNSSKSGGSVGKLDVKEEDNSFPMSEEEQAAFAAAEAARAAALAAAEAYASSGAKGYASLQLPKIPSFHKFARREQYAQMDESELIRRKWSGGVLGRQDCISEIDSRNCRVRDWSLDFSAACVNLDSSKMSVDNLSQRSHSNEIACQMNFREHSGESAAVDSSIFTKAWVDTGGGDGVKDYHAIERWQSQAAAADSDFFNRTMHVKDEEDSNTSSKLPNWKHAGLANEGSVSQVTINKELQPRGADRIKQAVVDYVASLLMPLYKSRKIDKEGYKSIMKKTATKVMEQATDAEKAMVVSVFLDSKRRNKIRSFVDKLIERHMAVNPAVKSR